MVTQHLLLTVFSQRMQPLCVLLPQDGISLLPMHFIPQARMPYIVQCAYNHHSMQAPHMQGSYSEIRPEAECKVSHVQSSPNQYFLSRGAFLVSQAKNLFVYLWETAARTCPFLPVSGCPSARNFSVSPSRMASFVLSDSICSHVARSRSHVSGFCEADSMQGTPATAATSALCSLARVAATEVYHAHSVALCAGSVQTVNSRQLRLLPHKPELHIHLHPEVAQCV